MYFVFVQKRLEFFYDLFQNIHWDLIILCSLYIMQRTGSNDVNYFPHQCVGCHLILLFFCEIPPVVFQLGISVCGVWPHLIVSYGLFIDDKLLYVSGMEVIYQIPQGIRDEPNYPGFGSSRIWWTSKRFQCWTRAPLKSIVAESVKSQMPSFWANEHWVNKTIPWGVGNCLGEYVSIQHFYKILNLQ